MNGSILSILLVLSVLAGVTAGPIAYALCQTGCNTAVVACYASAGLTFGTATAGLGAPAAALACNVLLGTCMASCAGMAIAPTP